MLQAVLLGGCCCDQLLSSILEFDPCMLHTLASSSLIKQLDHAVPCWIKLTWSLILIFLAYLLVHKL